VSCDVADVVSAAHLLKVALWDRRRGAEVEVFLTDDAVGPAGPGDSMAHLDRLCAAGVRLLACASVIQCLGEHACRLGIAVGTDDDLAALLRVPGIRAVWC